MIELLSFGYKNHTPKPWEHDNVVDCRSLPNPHSETKLRSLDGRDPQIIAWLRKYADTRVNVILQNAVGEAHDIGDSYRVAFGCHGGKHRSVAMAEELAKMLRERGHTVNITHMEIPPSNPKSNP